MLSLEFNKYMVSFYTVSPLILQTETKLKSIEVIIHNASNYGTDYDKTVSPPSLKIFYEFTKQPPLENAFMLIGIL